MKITFIRPNMGIYKAKDALQPLAIAVLDGLTPPGAETVFYDDRIEEIPLDLETDIVAISVETFTQACLSACVGIQKKRHICGHGRISSYIFAGRSPELFRYCYCGRSRGNLGKGN